MRAPGRLPGAFSTSLRLRVALLMALLFLVILAPAYLAFEWLVRSTTVELGKLFAEKQVLYDRYRGLEALRREVSLAQALARSRAVVAWAADEADSDKRARALIELERFRADFEDNSYFFVIDASGHYYFNDGDNRYAGRRLRYRVDPDNPRDGWYFATAAGPDACQPNVDHDDNLAVTKVWINCKVMDGERMVGMIGTGMDLTGFIQEVVDVRQRGVESIFIDRSGAIQAHRDPTQIDFHSLTKDIKAKKTIFNLLDRPADREVVSRMMERVATGDEIAEAQFVLMDGREALAGIGYLDEIGWYNVTVMNLDEIIRRDLFRPIAGLLALILAAATVFATVVFKRSVLDRLALLETWSERVARGDYSSMDPPGSMDEIGRLTRAFAEMARSVAAHTRELEAKVQARTEKLERLARIDPLTGVVNRRGFLAAIEPERNRAQRSGVALGLVMVDLDRFKAINDTHGHIAGDQVLVEVAHRLAGCVRTYDVVGRWGGDEFIVLAEVPDSQVLGTVAEKLRRAVSDAPIALPDGNEVVATISVGAGLLAHDASIDAIIAQIDIALLDAKRRGRDQVGLRA